jgi:long-chain acyl-CoA synthetase
MTHRDRPWLRAYTPGLHADLEPEFSDGRAMFRSAVSRSPGTPLIHYFGATLTVKDIDRMSDALAAALEELGIRAGDRVAVYMQNMPQFIVTMLATWKCGAIMVSINPMSRSRELELVLRDSGAVALVSLAELHEKYVHDVSAPQLRVTITTSALDLAVDTAHPLLAGLGRPRVAGTHDLMEMIGKWRGRRPTEQPLTPDSVALLTYTSGTTGPPKGAMNTHRNVVFNAQAYRDWIGLTRDDVVLGMAPLFHITGLIAHIAVALLVPMPLVLSYRFDPATMLDLIERYRVTFTIASITAFVSLLNDPSSTERDVASLTKVYSGGQSVAAATLEQFESRFGIYIHIAYGLTETTSPSHLVPFGRTAPVDPSNGAVSVGVPIFSTVSFPVDDDGRAVPPGSTGELVIGGPQVVPGYWEKPVDTLETFPNGMLRTGDIGYMNDDGWFFVVDRKKDLINVSGYKVWPREVEDVLCEHPSVREAAVVGVPDPYRGENVKAYVSLRVGCTATEDELISFCRDHLAAYKYPRVIDIIAEIPKNLSGKILRRELRQQARDVHDVANPGPSGRDDDE